MDISLEFDIDFSNIPPRPTESVDSSDVIIKDYLRGKINDFKRLSEISRKKLSAVEEEQNQCSNYLKQTEQFDSVHVCVKNIWQRIHNDQWVIGIHVKNTAERAAEGVNLVLMCIPKQNLDYSIKLYTKFKENPPEEFKKLRSTENADFKELIRSVETTFNDPPKWIPVENLQKETTIVVRFNIPKFIDSKELVLKGILSYKMTSTKYQLKIPNISLQVNDLLSDELTPKLNNVVLGNEEELLSILTTSQVTPIRIILPEGLFRTLEGLLQLDCSFTKCEDTLFVFDGKSCSLNHAMIRIGYDKVNIDLITKNEEQLHLLYHHLYKNIPYVVLLNENCEKIAENTASLHFTQAFFEPVQQDQTILKDFVDSFERQLVFLEDKIQNANKNKICEQSNKLKCETIDDSDEGDNLNNMGECEEDMNITLCETSDDYKLLRFKLNELEKQSDELFFKAINKKC